MEYIKVIRNNFPRRRQRAIWKILAVILLLLIIFVVSFLIQRNIRIAQIEKQIHISTPNGIESLEFVEIGGIRQAILIRGNDVSNPILLMLHGGPGYPEIAAQRGSFLEDYYTVVYFEQRLSGKTYFANDRQSVKENDSMELRIQDVIDLSEYLTERFQRPKIALLGGSWGSVLGINAVQRRPDLYSVFISISQLANHETALRLAYDETLRLATEASNTEDVSALEKIAPFPSDTSPMQFEDDTYYKWWKLQGIYQKYNDMPLSLQAGGMLEGFWPQAYSPYYSLREATYFILNDIAMITGKGLNEAAAKYMFEEFDLRKVGLRYDVPLIIGNGELDWIAPPCLVQEVFDEIEAPYKKHHIYTGAGHGYNYTEFVEVMTIEALPFALSGNV